MSTSSATFLAYAGPNKAFATKSDDELRKRGVAPVLHCFDSKPTSHDSDAFYDTEREHNRVVVVCSQASLSRPEVLAKLNKVRSRLVPISLDHYITSDEFAAIDPDLAKFLVGQLVGIFIDADKEGAKCEGAYIALANKLRGLGPW